MDTKNPMIYELFKTNIPIYIISVICCILLIRLINTYVWCHSFSLTDTTQKPDNNLSPESYSKNDEPYTHELYVYLQHDNKLLEGGKRKRYKSQSLPPT